MSEKERSYLKQEMEAQYDSNLRKSVPWKHIMKSIPVWALVICGCGNSYGMSLFMFQLPAYMKNTLGLSLKSVIN